MENISKERSSQRRIFTITANRLESILNNPLTAISPSTSQDLQTCIERLFEIISSIEVLDKNIQQQLIVDATDDMFDKEIEDCDKYRTRYLLLRNRSTCLLSDMSASHAKIHPAGYKMKYMKLPVLELRKFDGNIKNWLHFWGQFSKIDQDEEIDNIDKFQYLLQSMEKDTEVRKFVENFPPTATSYKDCLEQLKNRYAREELLVMVYVRELLSLVLKDKETMTLSTLFDKLSAQLKALESLGVTKDKYSAFILPMIESSLPNETLRTWERSRPASLLLHEELEALLEFLQKEVECDHRINMTKEFSNSQSRYVAAQSAPSAACFTTSTNAAKDTPRKCIWCDKNNHSNMECFQIAKMTLEQRKEHLKKKRVCLICLRAGHHAKICKAYVQCYVCRKRHSAAMCPGISTTAEGETERKPHTQPNKKDTDTPKKSTANLSSLASGPSTTLLQTAVAQIVHGKKRMQTRVLFDSGSQRSYVKKDLMNALMVPPAGKEVLGLQLFGGVDVSSNELNVYSISVENLDNSFKFDISVLEQTCICKNIPRISNNDQYLNNLLSQHSITLTDKGENYPDIGLLIGADFLGLLMTGGLVHLPNGLVAIKSKLGWTLQGTTNIAKTNTAAVSLLCSLNFTDLWSLETLGIRDPVEVKTRSQAEADAMESFEENVTVDVDGRYEVQLPWKVGHDNLLNNYDLAHRRLKSCTKRLMSTNKFDEYNAILNEWRDLKIIEVVQDPDKNLKDSHYLPHQAIIKENSLTTKLRPVFDASAKDLKGKTLNSCLEKGPNCIENIPKLLVGFRRGAIGVSADIAKAFLAISVAPRDRDYLRFLWWADNTRTRLLTYRHRRVVFGLTSSPFLLSATIQHHLKKSSGRSDTIDYLRKSFYVDNCITSLETEKEVRNFINQSKNIMQEAQFDLRQWVTAPLQINETGNTVVSILGLLWDTTTDELYFNMKTLPPAHLMNKITKRILLSLAQRIFDPIGAISPVTLVPKLILQEMWLRGLAWDEQLPDELLNKFKKWYEHLTYLSDCKIPRRLTAEAITEGNLSLHMFSDASKQAMAACVFLRAEKESKVSVQLISAKARVAPSKNITIPRLELAAALIGARLLKDAKENLVLPVSERFWIDSGVALYWIKRELPWNTYIGNRVREIRQITDVNNWYHLPGELNWADVASRGCNAKELLSLRWWEGPHWLLCSPDEWPQSTLIVDQKEAHLELQKTVCNTNTENTESVCSKLSSHFSKYTKIIRTMAWMLRFINNTQKSQNYKQNDKELTYQEYEEAEKKIIRLIQTESKEMLEKKCAHLTTFYDENKLIRLKTKLLFSNFPETAKAPYLLPAKNSIVRRMVEQRHAQMQHAGTNMLIADIRSRFWIVGIRLLAKSVISHCVRCKRHRVKAIQPPTAPLPRERIQCSAPFQTTGVDLAGPLVLRDGEKCWVVLYTCAVYRAVHLELTKSLSTEAFLMTLRRFIARRGRPTLMISDQGTNFVGTKNLFAEMDWNAIQQQSTVRRIQWKFNAPTAAWWGGFFERLIRIMKDLLRRVLGKSCVHYDELETVLCDCEAIMNARPLTYVEDDTAGSLEPLTPACFLQCLPHTEVCDIDHLDSKSLNTRMRYVQRLRSDFKERFKNEYLTTLVQKGKKSSSNVAVGDIVLIHTDEKRIKWPLGLIIETYEGKDGVDRTALVKTSTGLKTRPFQRLYPLELQAADRQRLCIPTLQGKNKNIQDNTLPLPIQTQIEENQTKVTRSGRSVKIPGKYSIYSTDSC